MRVSDELRERTKRFGSLAIRIYVDLPKDREEVRILGRQLLRSGTSVAAHAREASRARSDAEFISKIESLLQEADESQLWLEYLQEDCDFNTHQINQAQSESSELIAIFTSIVVRLKARR